MFKLKSLTGVKPTKDAGTQIIASPSKGQIKVTPKAAKELAVSAGERLEVFTDDMTGDLFIVKGVDGKGGKLAAANATGAGTLTFSSGNSWNELKGDENYNVHYDLGEGTWVLIDEQGNGEVVDPGTEGARCYFKLEFVEKVEKAERKPRSKKADTSADVVSEASADEDAPFGDVEQSENGFADL